MEATEEFEQNRDHLRAVAQRMLGSAAEADDAVQEAWLRLSRSDTAGVENMRSVADDGGQPHLPRHAPGPPDAARGSRRRVVRRAGRRPVRGREGDPEHEALLADSVGVALMVVLDTLAPAERLAFVLHDMFGVPFDEIGPIIDRNAGAARQLASRARRRVRGAHAPDAATLGQQRKVVDAFLAASREGDFEALLEVLDPDVVFRAEAGATGPLVPRSVRGARRRRDGRARARRAVRAPGPAGRSSTAGRVRWWLSPTAWCRWSRSRSSATASPRWTYWSTRSSSGTFRCEALSAARTTPARSSPEVAAAGITFRTRAARDRRWRGGLAPRHRLAAPASTP